MKDYAVSDDTLSFILEQLAEGPCTLTTLRMVSGNVGENFDMIQIVRGLRELEELGAILRMEQTARHDTDGDLVIRAARYHLLG